MNEEELGSFLDRALTAIVGTANAAGNPHAVPVWYRYDGSVFIVWADASRRWVRNIERRRDVSVVVAEHGPPFAAVVARGTAEISTDAPGMDDEIVLITRRYLPLAEVKDYVARWSNLRTMVRITPSRIVSWRRGY